MSKHQLNSEDIVNTIKWKLSGDKSPFQLLLVFKQYRDVIIKANLLNVLRGHREELLVKLVSSLDKIESQVERGEFRSSPSSKGNISPLVNSVYFTRQLHQKIKDVKNISESLLNDLTGYSGVLDQIKRLLDSITKYEKTSFEKWTRDSITRIREDDISLKDSDQVIDYTENRLMAVNYNVFLPTLIDEAHQLSILGFPISNEIINLVTKAKKFTQVAQELNQIANFHNTIGDRMIPSIKPMMLDTALKFDAMVSKQKVIKWNSVEEVADYAKNFKLIVSELGKKNNELSQFHFKIKEKLVSLTGVDLIKNQQKWKEVIKDTKEIFNRVESLGYNNIKSWLKHWDHQLYKLLESKYLEGINSLHLNMPELKIELIFSEDKLQFKPQLEEIKMKYYAQMKNYLEIPQSFRGFSDDPEFFANIIESNSNGFNWLFTMADALFKKVEKSKSRFQPWVAFSNCDIKKMSIEYLVTAKDFDLNFRTSKQKSQEINSIDITDQKIGCITIVYTSIRLEIELVNRRYWEVLTALLKGSIINEMAELETFVNEAINTLKNPPQSMEEIASANQIKEKYESESPKMEKMLESLEEKNNVLKTWTKNRIEISRIKTLWENFISLLDNHQSIIGHQIENIKSRFSVEINSLNNRIENFKIKWDEFKPKESIDGPENFEKHINFLQEQRDIWNDMLLSINKKKETCKQLGISQDFPLVDEIEKDLTDKEQSWSKLKEFWTGLKEFEDEDWVVFRTKPYKFEEFLQEWEKSFKSLENKPSLVLNFLRDIEKYKTLISNLKYIRGDIFIEKHWYELLSMLKIPVKTLDKLKLGDFTKSIVDVGSLVKELKDLNARASGEILVRSALNELDAWEIEAQFDLSENKDAQNKPIYIISDFKSVLNKIGDNQSLLQSIKTSPYFTNFSDQINMWEIRLTDLDLYLQQLNKIQRRWLYLEPIFSHGVLESEQQRFRRIDSEFRDIMQRISEDKRIISLSKITGIRQSLSMLLDQLSRCQTSLNEFLEKKRSAFPRFYFIGDDDLLEILGQSTKSNIIQAHLKKLFAGIYSVDFDENFKYIRAMKSIEGEVVPLKSQIKISTNVEEWLSELANEMKCTLKSSLLDCVSESKSQSSNPDKFPAQIVSLSNSIIFTERCEEAIRSRTLEDFLKQLQEELSSYSKVLVQSSANTSTVRQLKIKDLLLDILHEIDIVSYLLSKNTKGVNDWNWQKQLRFYIREDGNAYIKMADAEFSYSYEYQGNNPKLVHTPLTDKCYLTLTQGMRMGLGGNPYGPAGTGKTESVKALGGIMGRQVLVFNCDEGIDVKSMGRIFVGLALCGAWGCFDEFNRLEGATLSAVSMQIQPIQSALKSGAKSVKLLDEKVPLDPNTGIFVTLNPAGKDYGGRNKLPDNLKQLFRPVVMSSPDNEIIAESILFTEGFKNAKKIGRKLVEIFNLCSKLLPSMTHYDWGLRALKTVLKGCGNSLKASDSSLIDEVNIAVSTLRLNVLPKLTYTDCKRFDRLITDVFGDVTFGDIGDVSMIEILKDVIQEMNLILNEKQIRKCLELNEQLKQRMGVVIVGPSCCGKSTVLNILRNALIKQGHVVKTHVINPKAVSRTKLLGYINMDTRQWNDGILTLKAQQVYSEPLNINSWIICDGDIDPEWIESLNSVLDDNRLLTLPSGWRIKFESNVNFIFETHDLSYASPATVSRMGMIFMSEEDLEPQIISTSWFLKQPEDVKKTLDSFNSYFESGLKLAFHQQSDNVLSIPRASVVMNALSQLSTSKLTSTSLVVYLSRGLSGHLDTAAKIEFSKKFFELTNQKPPSEDCLNIFYDQRSDYIGVHEPEDLDPYDEFHIDQPPLVKTANVKRVLDIIKPWIENQEPFILAGPQGCGKTLILREAFSSLRSTQISIIHCSSLISPQHVLEKLTQLCVTISTNKGRIYKSKDGENLILFFKDLNLVRPDKWGTCQLVEFLLQIIKYKGFYDQNLEWVYIQGVQIVASVTIGSSGRHILSPRFTSIVRICTMSIPERKHLNSIYSNYLCLLFKNQYPSHSINQNQNDIKKLAQCMVSIYEALKLSFTTFVQKHYHTTPRILTNWVFGLMRYNIMSDDQSKSVDILQSIGNECRRLFGDRLISPEHKASLDVTIDSMIRQEIGNINYYKIMGDYYFISELTLSTFAGISPENSMSNNFGSIISKVSPEQWRIIVEKGINIFSREVRELNVVLFPEVLKNVANIDRALSTSSSSLVLAGQSGIGRRTAVCIVAALHNAEIFTLKIGRDYSMKQFKNDLKTAIQLSAVEGKRLFFIIEDYQLVDILFLDMINSLLSSGEIPGLYTPEEFETILSPLREIANNEGYSSSLFSFFANRVKTYLHVIMIMDYNNENFADNCENNPAFYKLSSIIWYHKWSDETIRLIPNLILHRISEISVEIERKKSSGRIKSVSSSDKLIPASASQSKDDQFNSIEISQLFSAIYFTFSKDQTSPRQYFAFLYLYSTLYHERKDHVISEMKKLKAGILKLKEAKEVVERLKNEATKQEVTLATKKAQANEALDLITDTMRNANTQRVEVNELKQQTMKENEILLKKKQAIDLELQEIEPLIQQSRAAVGNIKNEALSEIRSLRAPPEVIRDILEGVLRLMGNLDLSWNSMKTFLSQRGIKEEIRNFDARNIKKDDLEAVEKLLKTKQNSFEDKNAKRASAAAAPLASWVLANVKFARVLEKIGPLERQQKQLQSNLAIAEKNIGKLSEQLENVDQTVENLKKSITQYTQEAAEIEFHLTKAKNTLQAAETLVEKLLEEYKRWEEQLKELENELQELPKFSVLASAFITYLSYSPGDERVKSMAIWCELCKISNYDVCKFLSSERELLKWHSFGLPSDELSQQNGVSIINSILRPYLIDPSCKATEWLQKLLEAENRQVQIISLQDPKLPNELEMAVRFGKVLIVQEADDIEPILVPLLRGDIVMQGSRELILIGDKLVDYNPDFRLFLSTRSCNPKITPISSIVTIVNFTTTRAGLTRQLLNTILSHEKPELNSKKKELVKNIESLKVQLDQIGDTLLQELVNAQGNILENQELLESLNRTKASAMAISASLKESSGLDESLTNEVNVYLPLAIFGSQLYFTMRDASKINHMYQFSLSSFIYLFEMILSIPNNKESTEVRIDFLMKQAQNYSFDYICRSLFKADRLAFSLHLAHEMRPDLCGPKEWEAFSSQLVMEVDETQVDLPDWVSDDRHFPLQLLGTVFPELYKILEIQDRTLWSDFYYNGECEKFIPQKIRENLTPFQIVMVIQTLRPDRLLTSMTLFAQYALGRKSLYPSPVNFKLLCKDTRATEPILILISGGADPSQELKELASNAIGDENYFEISMGHGQAEIALGKLHKAAENGQWLCLKNLHLVIHWLDTLEKEVQNLKPNQKFRLWLTSEPHHNFPNILAESCLKIAYEAPQGIKKNLQRTYDSWDRDYITGDGNLLRIQSFFILAFFHAVVQERRTYIPQGWSKPYEFNESDLRAGVDVLDQIFKGPRAKEVQWEVVHGLFVNAIYGGRIDNDYDNRILQSYLKEFFCENAIRGRSEIASLFNVPSSAKIKDYIELIFKLPEFDSPKVFGLPINVQRSWQKIVSSQVVNQLKALSSKIEHRVAFEQKLWQNELNPYLNQWRKLHQASKVNLIQASIPDTNSHSAGNASPIKSFVILEYTSVITLIQTIHRNLGVISKTIRSGAQPAPDVLQLANYLLKREVPLTWSKMWESGPDEPLTFLSGIVKRGCAIYEWYLAFKKSESLPMPVDLCNLLNPQTFLTAFKQECARKQAVPMDELYFVCNWKDGGVSKNLTSLKLTGFLMEGCVFDGKILSEITPDSQPIVKAPDCIISWISKKDMPDKIPQTIIVPLYYNEKRENLIGELKIPLQGDESTWIKAGIALFLKS